MLGDSDMVHAGKSLTLLHVDEVAIESYRGVVALEGPTIL